jgi:LmbE family N-acetylglucosaminyl deacetylase
VKILLAPHADDETLFACYTLLRERPLVILCLPGAPRHGSPEVRPRRWRYSDVAGSASPTCPTSRKRSDDSARLTSSHRCRRPTETVNTTSLASSLRASGRAVTFYTTYTSSSRTTLGYPVPAEPSWPELKRRALACYESQATNRGTREHFLRPLDEYLVSWEGHMSEARAA